MKNIKVNMEAFFGYGCAGGEWHGAEDSIELEIEDAAAATLKTLQSSGATLDQDVVKQAIADGHAELQPVYDVIAERFYNMVEEYWLYEADNECIDESLEPAFRADLENELYVPELTFDDYMAEQDEDADEDDCFDDYYFDCRDAYLAWVRTHDHAFEAERVGLDLEACREDEVGFEIVDL